MGPNLFLPAPHAQKARALTPISAIAPKAKTALQSTCETLILELESFRFWLNCAPEGLAFCSSYFGSAVEVANSLAIAILGLSRISRRQAKKKSRELLISQRCQLDCNSASALHSDWRSASKQADFDRARGNLLTRASRLNLGSKNFEALSLVQR